MKVMIKFKKEKEILGQLYNNDIIYNTAMSLIFYVVNVF